MLIQGYRDTAAIQAKLDEIVIALREARNNVVGLEHADPKEIRRTVKELEEEANGTAVSPVRPTNGKRGRLKPSLR